MSRLKFRAWIKPYGGMEGFYLYDDSKTDFNMISNGGDFSVIENGVYIDDHFFIIEQFTGLTDKNGVEIFEGDIVKSIVDTAIHDEDGDYVENKDKAYYNAVEHYNGMTCGWRVRRKSFHRQITESWLFNQQVVVIGNIHENPELLEQQS